MVRIGGALPEVKLRSISRNGFPVSRRAVRLPRGLGVLAIAGAATVQYLALGTESLSISLSRYPMEFFARNVDGRIDDPNAGWKGKGLWSTYGSSTNFHLEGGKENRPRVVKIHLRPHPLAQ